MLRAFVCGCQRCSLRSLLVALPSSFFVLVLPCAAASEASAEPAETGRQVLLRASSLQCGGRPKFNGDIHGRPDRSHAINGLGAPHS